jgi:hypothetical protein
MTPLDDDLALDAGRPRGTPDPELEPTETSSRWPAVAAAVVVALLTAGIWYWWTRDAGETAGPAAPPAVTEGAVPPVSPLGAGPEAEGLPPLDDMDGYLRPLLAGLSARPELAALLATDNLVRRFVVSVENIARGANPSGQVRVIGPPGQFSVEQPETDTRVHPASFRRYDGLAATVSDLDAEGLATLYGRLRPRLQDAYAELGVGDSSFDQAMEQALRHLLVVNPNAATGRVRPEKGVTYRWSDENTENLSSAQKQLLRMGPDNVRTIQRTLREFALALGIPATRLPPPNT